MLKFPCNECCLYQYYEFKNIIDDYYYKDKKKDKIIIFNSCLILTIIVFGYIHQLRN
jgi:hypothetical protein